LATSSHTRFKEQRGAEGMPGAVDRGLTKKSLASSKAHQQLREKKMIVRYIKRKFPPMAKKTY